MGSWGALRCGRRVATVPVEIPLRQGRNSRPAAAVVLPLACARAAVGPRQRGPNDAGPEPENRAIEQAVCRGEKHGPGPDWDVDDVKEGRREAHAETIGDAVDPERNWSSHIRSCSSAIPFDRLIQGGAHRSAEWKCWLPAERAADLDFHGVLVLCKS